jgi:peroxiredoxin Q/BCP
VLGVSGDSLETHQAFAKEHGITFPLIDDGDGKIRRLYGSGRITFLIDREGIVRLIMKGVPQNSKLLEQLDQ